MTSRQRVLTAMQHEESDRAPLFYRDVADSTTSNTEHRTSNVESSALVRR